MDRRIYRNKYMAYISDIRVYIIHRIQSTAAGKKAGYKKQNQQNISKYLHFYYCFVVNIFQYVHTACQSFRI